MKKKSEKLRQNFSKILFNFRFNFYICPPPAARFAASDTKSRQFPRFSGHLLEGVGVVHMGKLNRKLNRFFTKIKFDFGEVFQKISKN